MKIEAENNGKIAKNHTPSLPEKKVLGSYIPTALFVRVHLLQRGFHNGWFQETQLLCRHGEVRHGLF
jgi:hypothetical protein